MGKTSRFVDLLFGSKVLRELYLDYNEWQILDMNIFTKMADESLNKYTNGACQHGKLKFKISYKCYQHYFGPFMEKFNLD